jgi:hypothetical protein
MGLFVDGAVIKSWLAKNADTVAYRHYVDLKNLQSWMPFSYMGTDQNMKFGENEVCEIWLGPFGEHLYHIHESDDPRYDSYAGGNPINRRSDPGRAYLFLTVTDPEKCGLTIRSFAKQFKKVTRYAGNFELQGQGLDTFVVPVPAIFSEEHAALNQRSSSGAEWKLGVVFEVGVEQRFLAKIARGLGYKLFGDVYLDTPYGIAMQRAIWEKDREVRGKLIRGVSLLSGRLQGIRQHTSLPGTYSILLWAQTDAFVLVLTLPDGNNLSVVISDEPKLWSAGEFDSYREGVMYIVAPQVQKCIGPIEFPDFLAHLLNGAILKSVADLESMRTEQLS